MVFIVKYHSIVSSYPTACWRINEFFKIYEFRSFMKKMVDN
jgi:hypothetical protein